MATKLTPDVQQSLYTQHILRVKNINAYMILRHSIQHIEKNFLSSPKWRRRLHQQFLAFHQTPLKILWSFKTPHQLYTTFYENHPKRFTHRAPVFFWGLAMPIRQCRMVFHIHLNRFLINHYDTQEIQCFDTIAHEFAHCLEMYMFGISKVGHSSVWYDIAQQCGCVFLEPYRSRLRKYNTASQKTNLSTPVQPISTI